MSWKNFLSSALFLGAVFLACSEGREDPLGTEIGVGEGLLSLGGNGANAAVTESNGLDVLQSLDEVVFDAYVKSAAAMTSAPEISGDFRITGGYSGYVVASGAFTSEGTVESFSFKMTFYDYSNSGALFLGGALQCTGEVEMVASRAVMKDITVKDGIRFAGSYAGSVLYEDFPLPADNGNKLVSLLDTAGLNQFPGIWGTATFTSGGNTFKLFPYAAKPGGE